jgi:large conductance mechanosensitive channel
MLYVMKDKIVTNQINGFMNFIRQQGVVGLAVGLVLGTSIKSFVDSIVNNIVNPLIGYFIGGVDLSDKAFCLTKSTDPAVACQNSLAYGQVITNLIGFITISAIVYFFVKGLRLDKLDIPADKK